MKRAARLAAVVVALVPGPAAAREVWSHAELSVKTVTALKSSVLLVRAPPDRALFPDPTGAESLWQLRLDAEAVLPASLRAGVAWQTALAVSSGSGGAGGLMGVLPGETPVAYRVRPLAWPIGAEGEGRAWRHELDRLWLSLDAGPARLTAGRQAVGWGRGVLFGAVDVFAPFAALAADREWRPGVDAARLDLKLGQHLAADAVAAFEDEARNSAFGARLRGFRGEVDGELVAGWRAGDAFAGVTASAAAGDTELHAELALFRTGDRWPGALGGAGRLVPTALLGASWRIPAGNGVYLLAEVFHAGFGLEGAGELLPALADPAARKRLLRGDSQTLGRDTAAVTVNYEVSEVLTATLTVLESLQDGSGVAVPGATLRLSDALAVTASLYPSWGRRPGAGAPRSFWGTTPLAAWVQVAVYD